MSDSPVLWAVRSRSMLDPSSPSSAALRAACSFQKLEHMVADAALTYRAAKASYSAESWAGERKVRRTRLGIDTTRPRRTERYPIALGSWLAAAENDSRCAEWPRRGERRIERRTGKKADEGDRACEAYSWKRGWVDDERDELDDGASTRSDCSAQSWYASGTPRSRSDAVTLDRRNAHARRMGDARSASSPTRPSTSPVTLTRFDG